MFGDSSHLALSNNYKLIEVKTPTLLHAA